MTRPPRTPASRGRPAIEMRPAAPAACTPQPSGADGLGIEIDGQRDSGNTCAATTS